MRAKFLEEIGLTRGETAVYTALLELGQTTTGPIIRKAKVSSSKTYQILDKLIEKGLASYIVKSNTRHFEATPPERIMDYLDEKERNILQQKEEAEKLIKEIKLKQVHLGHMSDATVFRGLRGLKTAYEVSKKDVQNGETVYGMFLPEVSDELLPFFRDYISHFSRQFKVKNLLLFNEYTREIELVKNIRGVQIRIVPKQFKAPTEISIHHNNVIISTTGGNEYIAILIRNKDIADSFKSYFRGQCYWLVSR